MIAHLPIFDNKPIAHFLGFDSKPIAHSPFIFCQRNNCVHSFLYITQIPTSKYNVIRKRIYLKFIDVTGNGNFFYSVLSPSLAESFGEDDQCHYDVSSVAHLHCWISDLNRKDILWDVLYWCCMTIKTIEQTKDFHIGIKFIRNLLQYLQNRHSFV